MSEENLKELAEILKSQLDGTLDEVPKHRLAELLRGDRTAQAYYVEFCQMHAMLSWEHGVLGEVETDASPHSVWHNEAKSKRQPARQFW